MPRDDATLLDKAITGMRDKLIHHYDAVDWDQVWRSASVDIPRLQRALESLSPPRPAEE